MNLLYLPATILLAILACIVIVMIGYVVLTAAMLLCCVKLTIVCFKCAVNFVLERN